MVSILELFRPVRPAKTTLEIRPAYVVHGRSALTWLLVALVLVMALAAAAWLYQELEIERARRAQLLASQASAEDQRDRAIRITFQDEGVVCTVPPERADVAPIVHATCQTMVMAMKRGGHIK